VIEVSDGTVSAISPVSVAIAPVYDPPVVRPAAFETAEDTLAEGKLPGSDPDGTALTFHLLSAPRLGKAELIDASTGAWRFTPGADLNGDDTLAFDVSDGTTTVKGTVKLHVAPVNDRPLLANLELATIEDRGVDGVLRGTDVDGDALTYSILTQPKQGKCAIVDAAKGTFHFEPARDQNGPASCTAAVTDGKLASAPATVTIQIEPQNDAPIAINASLKTDEDEVLTGKVAGTDVDRDPLSYAVVRAPAHGTLKLLESGAFTYVPSADYFGADSFSFSATDPSKASGEGLVQLAIAPVNDAPVANADVISAPSRGSVTGRLHGFDRENQRLSFKIVGQPSSGHVKLVDERTGDFVLTTEGAHGDLRFQFVVSDGELTSEPAEWVVQINNM
jgi:hypothetical protein